MANVLRPASCLDTKETAKDVARLEWERKGAKRETPLGLANRDVNEGVERRRGRVVHGNCLALCTKSFLIFRACRYKAVVVVCIVVAAAAAPWVLYYNLTFLLLQHFCLCVCLWLTK